MRARLVAPVSVLMALCFSAPPALAQDAPCDDHKVPPASQPTTELTRDPEQESIQIGLADKDSGEGEAELTATLVAGASGNSSAPVAGAQVAAEIAKRPRSGTVVVKGLHAGAVPNNSGTGIWVHVCRTPPAPGLKPGRYTGSVRIYGPTIKPLEYPLVVTAKDSWWLALAILACTGAVVLLLGIVTKSLPDPRVGHGRGRRIVGVAVAAAVVLVADGLTYFGSYDANETWGANRKQDWVALGVAGATAAGTALAGYARVLKKK